MKIFFVYQNLYDENEMKVIESSSSIYAGIFNIFWAFYHSMWRIAIPLAIFMLFINKIFSQFYIDVFEFFLMILFFTLSEEMQSYNMKIKGYYLSDIVCANSKDEAEHKFFTRIFDDANI